MSASRRVCIPPQSKPTASIQPVLFELHDGRRSHDQRATGLLRRSIYVHRDQRKAKTERSCDDVSRTQRGMYRSKEKRNEVWEDLVSKGYKVDRQAGTEYALPLC